MGAPPGEKLQKVLARAGLGSRREIEGWIAEGRVSVDGDTARLGARVSPGQTLRVDARVVPWPREGQGSAVLAYHKPEGEVCTRRDPRGRPTVFRHLPRPGRGRWINIGRLDMNTSGLLLFTTDGELAHRLMHPRQEIEREYAVRVYGQVDRAMLRRLRRGVELDDGPARFVTVQDGGGEGANHWYRVTLKEGRQREVRRLWEAVGVTVSRLIRIRFGPVALPRGLRPGRWQLLEESEVRALGRAAGLAPAAGARERSGRTAARRRRMPRRR